MARVLVVITPAEGHVNPTFCYTCGDEQYK